MKLRVLAVLPIVTLAAWLPLAAQQSAPASQSPATWQDSGKPTAKPPACCCQHKDQQEKGKAAGAVNHSAMACCGKGNKDAKASMDCCAGKDATMCVKDGKSCCGSGDAKTCCGKDAVACNSKDAMRCCASASSCCAGHARGK